MNTMLLSNALNYYKKQTDFSDPKEFTYLYENLPKSIPELCTIVHGVITHRDLGELYNLKLLEERKTEPETRYVNLILKRILELDKRSIDKTRNPEKRFNGTCRDFALLLCSILRYQGISARLRCGFSAYFRKCKYEDHWLCEYWDPSQNRWILVDAQIDEQLKDFFNITIDVTVVPRNQFLVGGQVWIACRSDKLDPDNFGVSSIGLHGIGEIRGNICRDLASLNRIELLPWDDWDISNKKFDQLTSEEIELINNIAEITIPEVDNYEEFRKLYQNEKLTVPAVIISHTAFNGEQMINIQK